MDKLVKTSLMVLFLTCSTILSAQTGKTTLKIVHYNVGVFSKEIENSIPMIAGMMKELDADVISLNELDSCNLRHDTYQLRDFAEEMGGWDYRFVNALPYKGGAYGVGVCSRDRIISSGEIHLDRYDGSETRACCIVETEKYVLAGEPEKHYGLVIGSDIHSSLPDDEVNWEFPVHPDTKIGKTTRIKP